MTFRWTDEAVALLREYHAEGHSFAVIAELINSKSRHGLTTRNACIGRAHRMGLVSTNAPKPPKPYKPRTSTDAKLIDLTGCRFGQWTVKRRAKGSSSSRRVYWLCVCTCGDERAVDSHDLREGNSSGCGCKQGEKLRDTIARRKPQVATHPFPPRQKSIEAQVAQIVFAPGPEGLRFMEQKEGHCKWPISAETDFDNFRVCGCLCKMTQPYCDEHTAKAHQPKQPRPPRDADRAPAIKRNASEMFFKDWA